MITVFKCPKCSNPLDFKYALICHVCNPDLAIAMKIKHRELDSLKLKQQSE